MASERTGPGDAITVDALSLEPDGTLTRQQRRVVEEDALTLDFEGVGRYTLMWTPTADCAQAQGYTLADGVLGEAGNAEGLALAIGFALSEGIIHSPADLTSIAVCPDNPGVTNIKLKHPEKVNVQRRNVTITSSCGICGPYEIISDNALGLDEVPRSLRMDPGLFRPVMDQMRQAQRIFHATGGSHAAALFSVDGHLLRVCEDLGRHNAMDKAIGAAVLEQGNLSELGVVLSSRLSLEMVLKAVRCGLQLILAAGAPTSLAIDVADRFGVTLCGFVRDGAATIYTHAERIAGPRHGDAD